MEQCFLGSVALVTPGKDTKAALFSYVDKTLGERCTINLIRRSSPHGGVFEHIVNCEIPTFSDVL
jgi:hypothetical protein